MVLGTAQWGNGGHAVTWPRWASPQQREGSNTMGRNDILHRVTESERWSVINGLRIASDVSKEHSKMFGEIAELLRNGEEVAGFAAGESGARAAEALAWQFNRQTGEFTELASRVEDAPSIAVMHEEDED
jgi:hypothetical protein